MQWLDFLIIVILCVSLLWGLKTGILDVVFMCAGIVIGLWLSGRYADNVGELVNFSAGADTFVSVLAYIFIMSMSAAVFVMSGRVVKTIANIGTTGVADRISGLALGLVIGLALSGALIVILARLAFNFSGSDIDIPPTGIVSVDSADVSDMIEDKRYILVDGLVESKAVLVFLDVWNVLPRLSFSPVTGDFAIGLDLLAVEMDGNELAISIQSSRRGMRESQNTLSP